MRTLKAEEGKACHPGNGSAGGRVQRLEEHRTSRGVRCAPAALENPEDECLPRPVVLITASGLQGEQPLQGNRQNGSVTSGKGLALRAGTGVQSRTRRLSWTARAALAARAGRRVPGGTDWERALRGLFPGRRTVDSEL
ncbi:hypothetical protein Lal_00045101, partial [Lupinus albus]